MDSSDYPMDETSDNYRKLDDAKEWEHTLLQNTMGKELYELNKRLERKESEMKAFGGSDTEALKQHFEKKIRELEEGKRIVQQERDRLLVEIERLAVSDGPSAKVQNIYAQKLKTLEKQMLNVKTKQESQVDLLKQKQRSDEAAKRLQDGIQCIKEQKVQLQQKIKQEAECFRQWKASREKELLQLRKEGRRNEHERHKLQALNQSQKVRNEKTLQRWIDHELEAMVNVHAARFEYEKQSQVQAAFAEELSLVKQVDQVSSDGLSPPQGKSENFRVSSMSPNARSAGVVSPVNMLTTSSNAIVAMALQLLEKEERECGFTARGRWNLLRSMGDAENLLQYMFDAATDARGNPQVP